MGCVNIQIRCGGNIDQQTTHLNHINMIDQYR